MPMERLKSADFTENEMDQFFRPVTVDAGRRDVYISYHGDQRLRKLSTKEYYHISGFPGRSKLEDQRKQRDGVKELETNIPTTKTADIMAYRNHVGYMRQLIDQFYSFYDYRTAEINWKNFRSSQLQKILL
ncbi:hypothetical protein BDF20DRAFT_837151 [Mycotypha africana]|uniref:uncharacterized protein n=1 Tax=Mycotypha africana TaxID=64632 RepID=UPI00230185E1|nr:uncharacterized protein BDF20DRAFT_837151 [Mycotypha africana]KAI8973184.1 hypothetical protein BDF20DRAFT_837151 [Mycotypha africana]